MKDLVEQLKELYAYDSKHSCYQQLPTCLEKIINTDNLKIGSKYERERFDYIKSHIDLGSSAMDIGGNSGFFTLESITSGVKSVDYWEGNNYHARFVETAAKIVGFEKNITVHNEYFDFETLDRSFDTIFLLNVIHHLGVDFEQGIDIKEAKKYMLEGVNKLATAGRKMVFQMGYNWGGDVTRPIFEHGLKQEMIDYVSEGTKGNWKIESIGIPVKHEDIFVYEEACKDNLKRFDEYGEFLNRPLFIMESEVL